jgi:hypothetical protein
MVRTRHVLAPTSEHYLYQPIQHGDSTGTVTQLAVSYSKPQVGDLQYSAHAPSSRMFPSLKQRLESHKPMMRWKQK